MVDPGFQNGGPRFSLWWTAVFSENFGGPRFGGPRFSEEPGLVDPGLVENPKNFRLRRAIPEAPIILQFK